MAKGEEPNRAIGDRPALEWVAVDLIDVAANKGRRVNTIQIGDSR